MPQSAARHPRPSPAADLAVVVLLIGLFYGFLLFGREVVGELRPTVDIDLSLSALPLYTFYSLVRGLSAYVLSLAFTLAYGYWAARDARAEKVLVPILDILQSIPVLGFMPGLILGLVHLFPRSNFGLELAAVIMIFTGQAWNMTFSFYQSLKGVPAELAEAGRVYRLSPWRRLRWIELPYSTVGLVWNSMMSMAGGWFFLMINEAFVLGDQDFRLPGVGAYMSVAAGRGDWRAMVAAVAAMMTMIVLLDVVVWRPLVIWAQKFRYEDSTGQRQTSLVYDWLRRTRLQSAATWLRRAAVRRAPRVRRPAGLPTPLRRLVRPLALGAGLVVLAVAVWRFVSLLAVVPGAEWLALLVAGLVTLARVLVAVTLGTVIAVPLGLWIGLRPEVARVGQPIVQVAASFPAPMLFPAVIWLLAFAGVGLGVGSVLLMLLGTVWYILFNVVAGATNLPGDLRECVTAFRLNRLARLRALYLPAILPSLVTGWITAAGGAWNASIVAEFVTYRGETLRTVGLGAQIADAAQHARFGNLAAGVLVMAAMVVLFNRNVWGPLAKTARERYSITK
jgi:NitT/TauT family transport system permease protein